MVINLFDGSVLRQVVHCGNGIYCTSERGKLMYFIECAKQVWVGLDGTVYVQTHGYVDYLSNGKPQRVEDMHIHYLGNGKPQNIGDTYIHYLGNGKPQSIGKTYISYLGNGLPQRIGEIWLEYYPDGFPRRVGHITN